MAMLTDPEFWARLFGICVLNLLLSGDNALVIALAVRALPRRERILGQIWGAGGAVVLRLLFVGAAGTPDLAEDSLAPGQGDRKSTRLNSSHVRISYAVFCLHKKNNIQYP